MKKRILTVLLAVCLVFALGTVGALAVDGESTTKLPAADGGVITLKGDVEIEITELSTELKSQLSASNNKLEINLAGHTLTITNPNNGKDGVQIEQNANVTIKNGHVVAEHQLDGGHSLFVPKSGVSFTLDGVIVDTNGTGIYAAGSATAVNVLNSTINADGYAIGTNASADESGKPIYSYNVNINVSKSTLNAPIGALINVPGSLNISNSIITAQYQGVIARGGSTTIDNTAISLSSVTDADEYEKYENEGWGTGNAVPMGGIVVGNRSNAYNYPASCTVSGSTSVTVPDGTSAVYAYQMADTTNRKVDLAIKNGTFNADVVIAGDAGVTPDVSISGGKFTNADDLGGYLDDGYTFDENGNVEISDDAIIMVDGTPYTNVYTAFNNIKENSKVTLIDNINVDMSSVAARSGALTISADGVTFDGGDHTIKATGTNSSSSTHVLIISGDNVTVQNLIVDANNISTGSAMMAFNATGIKLNTVTLQNSKGIGLNVNSATVEAANLTTKNNSWGGVDVDPATQNKESSFTLKSGNVQTVYTDNDSNTSSTIIIEGGTVGEVYNHVDAKNTGNNTITIKDGIIGKVSDYANGSKANISVTGGTFGESVDEYAASDLLYEVMVSGEYTYYKNASDAIAAAGSVGNVKYIGDKTSSYTSNVTFVYEKGVYTEITIEDGTTIRLPGGQYKGKTITGWTLGNVTYKDGDRYKVNGNATFYVVLKDGEFDIVIDSKIEHGDISTNVNSADKGDTVYIYVDPDTGYVLDDIDVYYGYNYRNSVKVSYVRNNTYRFEMPNADVYITATFKANGMPFVDVRRTQWFYDSIYYVWSNDMMEGDSATTFNPDGTMTRAMFWAVLGRMDGQTITGTNWVEQARNWAMREGVSDGTNPNDYVTREQMVTMLWRYAGEKNGSANLNRYTDSGSVSGYAVEAMRWAIGNGVIQGVTSTTLAPKANATRAECATIFMRFDKM